MQNLDHNPYAHFKSPLLYDYFNSTLIHKYFCQIDDFTMCLWHLNRVHFAKSPKKDRK